MNIDQLFLRAIYKFLEKHDRKTIQWEDVVKSCFENFPEVFSFEKYSQWPDTWKIHNCMWRCRNQRHWIEGDAKIGISLTNMGKSLGAVKIEDKKYEDIKERKVGPGADPKLINFVKDSSLYKKYLKEKRSFRATESEIRSLLRTTMETDLVTVKRNMEYLKNIVGEYKEENLIEFCKILSKQLEELQENE